MVYKIWFVILVFLSLAGCATTGRNAMYLEKEQLQARVKQLEQEAQYKDRKISDLEYELDKRYVEPKVVKTVKIDSNEKTKPQKATSKNIQIALKKAGFYKGAIDGKIGKDTKKAVLGFQKTNGLTADGVVGKKTWTKLSKYLE